MDPITHPTTTGVKYRVEVVKRAGWHGVKTTCDRQAALHAEGTYISLGYLTRVREAKLRG